MAGARAGWAALILIRQAARADADAIWALLAPVIRDGETYPLDRAMARDDALAYWFRDDHVVFVAETGDATVGTYYLRANNAGGGSHVCNCGYIVAEQARGQGIAKALCAHSQDEARRRGYLAMQFNLVIATNAASIAAWTSQGFATVGRLPKVFDHPAHGLVDALVMIKALQD